MMLLVFPLKPMIKLSKRNTIQISCIQIITNRYPAGIHARSRKFDFVVVVVFVCSFS